MRSQIFLLVLCTLLVGSALACGDDSDDGGAGASGSGDGDGDVDCEDVPTYDEVSAFDKCTMCHSSELSGAERNNAPADHNFDTYEGAVEHLGHVLEEVEEGAMPPASSGITISAAEREALIKWASCDAPE